MSWHGLLHFVSGAIGFACLIAACLVVARRFAATGRRGWAVFSAVTGVLFLAGFASVASGAAWGTVAFAATAALAWAWLSALSIHHHSR